MDKKILTFDCYGTLFNTKPLYEHLIYIARKNGLSPGKVKETFINYEDRLMYGEDFIKYDDLLYRILEYCDMELNSAVFKDEWENIIAIHKKFIPFEDVLGTLKYLKERDYDLLLMSNTTHKIMNWHLEKLENVFSDILLAEDTKCYKPNLSFFEMAEQKFDLPNKEHCHIAKGYWWDIVPAAKMGWKKIWVNRDCVSGRKDELPYNEIKTLNELQTLL